MDIDCKGLIANTNARCGHDPGSGPDCPDGAMFAPLKAPPAMCGRHLAKVALCSSVLGGQSSYSAALTAFVLRKEYEHCCAVGLQGLLAPS